jgi:hypothetical protein
LPYLATRGFDKVGPAALAVVDVVEVEPRFIQEAREPDVGHLAAQ